MGRPKAIGLEKFNETLFEMRAYVSEEDRLAATKKLKKASYQTISNYLNKKCSSYDTALKLIEFFKERIAAREEIAVWVPPLKSSKHEEKEVA